MLLDDMALLVTRAKNSNELASSIAAIQALADRLGLQPNVVSLCLSAEANVHSTKYILNRRYALQSISEVLATSGEFERATTLAHSIDNASFRAETLCSIAERFSSHSNGDALSFVQDAWRQEATRDALIQLLLLASHFIVRDETLLPLLLDRFDWVREFLAG